MSNTSRELINRLSKKDLVTILRGLNNQDDDVHIAYSPRGNSDFNIFEFSKSEIWDELENRVSLLADNNRNVVFQDFKICVFE